MSRKNGISNDQPGTPFIGVLVVEYAVGWARSLKDRRQVVRSLLDHLKHKWNVSVLDLGPDEVWTRGSIALACLAESQAALLSKLDALEERIERIAEESDFVVTRQVREVSGYDEFSH